MVPDARSGFCGEQVAAGFLEELQNRVVLERRRIRHVHDNLSARERLGQSLAGDGVDARGRRRRQDLMALLTKPADEVRSDEAAAANDYDLHIRSPVHFPWIGARRRASLCERRMPGGWPE